MTEQDIAENRICAACGGVSLPDSQFCQHCGANLSPTAAERSELGSDFDQEERIGRSDTEDDQAGLEWTSASAVDTSGAVSPELTLSGLETTSDNDEGERTQQHQQNIVDAEVAVVGDRTVTQKIDQLTVNGPVILQQIASSLQEGPSQESGHIALNEVPDEEYHWVRDAFVKPEHYDEQWKHEISRGSRVFVVHGPEHAGKYTTALHLGMDLLAQHTHEKDMRLFLYDPMQSDVRSLTAFASSNRLGKNTVYVVRDAFENGIRTSELCQPSLEALNTALESKRNYLILTETDVRLKGIDIDAPKVDATVNPNSVLESYLKLYETHTRFGPVSQQVCEKLRTEKVRSSVLKHLKLPFHALSFGLLLKRLDPNSSDEDIEKCAEQAGRKDEQSARAWFAVLPDDNARLYVMLVSLLSGINRFQLDEIYTAVVQWLRKDGVARLRDPRETGLTDLLEHIGAVIEANQVRFSDEDHRIYVEREIDNHHHLLWSLKDLILEWAREYSAPEHWELRRNLGAAIGRLGTYHLDKLRTVLDGLAHDDNGGVVAVAGYALDAVCRRGPRYQSFALDLLERWVKSGDPWLMWAAGASIWRIYDGLLEAIRSGDHSEERRKVEDALARAQDLLTRLADRFDEFEDRAQALVVAAVLATANEKLSVPEVRRRTQGALDDWAQKTARSVLHAIRRMALSDSQGVVTLISGWLGKEEGSNLRSMGVLATYQLFAENASKDMQPLVDRHEPLLALTRPVLSTDEPTVDAMLTAIGSWLRDPDWEDRILAALLPLANGASASETQALRAGLCRIWAEHDEMRTRHMAQVLMSRSSLMNGYPADLPGESQGLLMIDASREGRLGWAAARLGQALHARLDMVLDLSVAHLGGSRVLSKTGDQPQPSDLRSSYSRSRLLVPLLERQGTQGVDLVLVATWGPIADVDDVTALSWSNCTLIADLSRGTAWPQGLAVRSFNPSVTENDPNDIELWARSRLAGLLALREPGVWRRALARWYPEVDLHDPDAVAHALEIGAAQLDDPKQARLPNDAARVWLAAVLYLAAFDLSHCVEYLKRWLNGDGSVKKLAVASGQLLFRVYGSHDPHPTAARMTTLLELASLLVVTDGIPAVETILEAVCTWASDKNCRERLLSTQDRQTPEMLQMIDSLPVTAQNDLRTVIFKWTTPVNGADEETKRWLTHLAERLILRLDLMHHNPVPTLPEGHRYGLIIADTLDNSDAVRRRLHLSDALVKGMRGAPWEGITPIVCRLGDGGPLDAESEKARVGNLPQRPRLLGPLLEVVQPLLTAFVLLLSDEAPLDAQDWPDTDWGPRIVVYTQNDSDPAIKQFALIAPHRDAKEAEVRILQELSQRLGA